MVEILFRLLAESPVIIFVSIFLGIPIVLSVVIYFLWKMLAKRDKQSISNDKSHKKDMKELNESKEDDLKEYLKSLRDIDAETRESNLAMILMLEEIKKELAYKSKELDEIKKLISGKL